LNNIDWITTGLIIGESDPEGRSDSFNKSNKQIWANYLNEHDKDGDHMADLLSFFSLMEEDTYVGNNATRSITLSDTDLDLDILWVWSESYPKIKCRATTMSTTEILSSPGTIGSTWTSRTTPNNGWGSVCYGNSLFVAVSSSGTGNRVMTSPDGITWTSRTSAADNDWTSVCYGSSLYVAVSNSGTGNRVMTSPDGTTWTSRTSAADDTWTSVCYGNSLYVAVASSGSGGQVMTSPDGTTWTSRTAAGGYQWREVIYANSLFVAVASDTSQVMTSADGITWTMRDSGISDNYNWYSVTYSTNDSLFVAVADNSNQIMTSANGTSWILRDSGVPAQTWRSVVYGTTDDLFAAVAGNGTTAGAMTWDGTLYSLITSIGTGTFGLDADDQVNKTGETYYYKGWGHH
jgi:predicted RecA/RadA family phage recombinase